ncbi:MAG: CDP-glucose 4,6-dehydratase [Chitinophagaceae bacterium]
MNYQQLFEATYKGKKVLLTGHTGFKGSWMLLWLYTAGAIVKGYALTPDSENSLYNMIGGDNLCDSVIDDIRNKEKLVSVIDEFQPDFIFHFAAQPLVRRSYEEPAYTFDVNIMGTANVLEGVRKLSKPCAVIIITTDKVYENNETGVAYCEEDRLGGYDPYSASKAGAEIVINSYRNSFFNPSKYEQHQKSIASVRAGNVIGGGDRAKDRIIPDIIRAFTNNETVVVRNPVSVRPWQHVLEPLSGYLLMGAKMVMDPARFSTAINFGPYPSDALTVEEVVKLAISEWGNGSYDVLKNSDQPHEAGLLRLDITKAEKELDWHPKMDAQQAIRQTIQWYKNATAENAFEFTKQQISQYQQL